MGVPGPNGRGGRRKGDGKRPGAGRRARPAAAGAAKAKPTRTKPESTKRAAAKLRVRKTSDMDRDHAQNTPDGRANHARANHARNSLAFTIPSDFTSGRDVQRQVMAAVARNGFDDDNTFAVRIALEEALVNAIKHGNRLDPAKKVRVQATVTPQRAEISIEDEGPGFDRAGVPDPTCDENICRPSGRGILLIESYMNDVRWDRGGRRINMVKRNEPGTLPGG